MIICHELKGLINSISLHQVSKQCISDEIQLLGTITHYLLSKSKEQCWKLRNFMKHRSGVFSANYKYPLFLLYWHVYSQLVVKKTLYFPIKYGHQFFSGTSFLKWFRNWHKVMYNTSLFFLDTRCIHLVKDFC